MSCVEAVRGEASRAGELRAERLVEADAVDRAHERPDQLRDERAVARMTAVARRQELHLGARDRRDQLGDARRPSSPARPGSMTTSVLAWVSSAAANTVRSAVCLPGRP